MSRAILKYTPGANFRASTATTVSLPLRRSADPAAGSPLGSVDYRMGMEAAGLAWIGAFVVFLAAYSPMLFRKRVDEARHRHLHIVGMAQCPLWGRKRT